MKPEFAYSGHELDLFAQARHWKSYWRPYAAQFVHGDVLEVGAGLGSNTRILCNEKVRRWVCLEPDPRLAARLHDSLQGLPYSGQCEVIRGTLAALAAQERFDTILYLDVLEHIEDDKAELRRAADCLRANGTLLILSPAHQWLFSAFDAALRHYRRYTKVTLAEAVPQGLTPELLLYLDSVGLLASLANRYLLKSRMPTAAQIKFWDTRLVICSRWLDPLLAHSIGKSVLGVWRKSPSP